MKNFTSTEGMDGWNPVKALDFPFSSFFTVERTRMHSRVQQTCKYFGTKESVYIRKELKYHRIDFVQQHGRRFIVLEYQYGCHDIMCMRSIHHFTVDCSVTWPLNGNKAAGDVVLMQTSLLLCKLRCFIACLFAFKWEKQSGLNQSKVTSSLTSDLRG